MMVFLIATVIMVITELVYFKLAERFNITDKPNDRSSHSAPTIRGGGIIFIIGLWLVSLSQSVHWPYFICGVSLVALISFLDDVSPRPEWIRFVVHLIAILLMFFEVQLFSWHWVLVLVALIVCIGTLNAFNFMDGINGITGIYALVNLGTFVFINEKILSFTDTTTLIILVIAILNFLFFNFRKQARCFAGDVGSITLAFVQIFFLLQLIQATDSLFWVLMFFIFGIDSVITILARIKRKENIFKPHRSHLYQYLSNELKLDQRAVALIYGFLQLSINCVLTIFLISGSYLIPVVIAALVLIGYVCVREIVVRKVKLSRSVENI